LITTNLHDLALDHHGVYNVPMNAAASSIPAPLSRDERLRRIAIVCCHFLRNLAFYRAGWRYDTDFRERAHRTTDQFWVNANSNSLDICVLEWCKLFGDKKGNHRWSRVVSDPQFLHKLVQRLKLTEDQFNAYAKQMREYRDWFIAHLDDERTMHLPRLRIARQSIAFLYDHLVQLEDTTNALPDARRSAAQFYAFWFRQGRQAYFAHEQAG
jgi:hypothetical protein